jgi:fused signal recognition particle receptor
MMRCRFCRPEISHVVQRAIFFYTLKFAAAVVGQTYMAFFWRRKKEDTFSSSVLGLDKSVEELKAQEEAVERELGVRFSKAIEKTRHTINDRLDTIFEGRKQIDDVFLDELEEMLISTDIGVATTMQILDGIRRGVSRQEINDLDALKRAMKQELLDILHHSTERGVADERSVDESIKPYVLMVVGVNGVGKTTTIGKLAQRIRNEGNEVLICAADTFRAAANDQLEIWAERAGVQLIQQKQGTDPAAVLFDALAAAKARNSDVLIVDTAGRLHNKAHLMAELEKMKRISSREVEGAPHETLLVIDAVTGHENGGRHGHRPDKARRHGQRRHRRGHRQGTETPDPLRRHRRTGRRPDGLRSGELRKRVV